jgi:hypothetical protein
MEKNPNYWNKGLPYPTVPFYILPFSPEMIGNTSAGSIMFGDGSGHGAEGQGDPRLTATDYYQSVIQANWVNTRRSH